MKKHFGENHEQDCFKIFNIIIRKLDKITKKQDRLQECQDDVLECLDTTKDLNQHLLEMVLRKKSLIKEPNTNNGGNTPKTT